MPACTAVAAAASNEEPTVLAIHGHRNRHAAGRDRIVRPDLERFAIQSHYLIRGFDVVVNHSLSIGHCLFGHSGKGHGPDHRFFCWVDHGDVVPRAVEGKYMLGRRVIHNVVGVLVCFDFAGGLEGQHEIRAVG